MELFIKILILALGFFMLVKGADWLVTGAAGISYRFGVPYLVVGLTIVAMGTSAPETAVSIISAIKGSPDVSVGNIIGSNILNIWLILGIASVAAVMAVEKAFLRLEGILVVISAILLFILGRDGVISFTDGIILLAVFAVYFIYLLKSSKLSRQQIKSSGFKERNYPMWQNVVFTIVGAALIIAGSFITVRQAGNIARMAGLSERFVGLTIVALGTSLPELFTSVSAARHGNSELAIGNIVGSNIFNILFVVGISAVIVPISFNLDFRFDALAAAVAGVILLIFAARKRIGKGAGITMLVLYGAYFVYLCQSS